MYPNLRFERALWAHGHIVAGVDEVGRGAWAGPLVAAAVVLPECVCGNALFGLKDSKKLTARARECFAEALQRVARAWALGIVDVAEIDVMGVGQANRLAMHRALTALTIAPTYALIDAFTLVDAPCLTRGILKGDERIRSIAAASVIAKVARDRMMIDLHMQDGRYRFDCHKGYGTALHQAQLKIHGPSIHHRRSFAPIRQNLESRVSNLASR